MADPSIYIYPSPLEGFENLLPLPEYVGFCTTQHVAFYEDGPVYRYLTMTQREERRWQVLCEPTSSQTQPSIRIFCLPHYKRRARRF